MSQRHLAWMGQVAAAHQPGMADGMVRRAEGPVADQRDVRGELVGHRIDAGHVQASSMVMRGKMLGMKRQQGLTGSGWSDEKHVVDDE